MNPWRAAGALLYHGLRVASRADLRVIDEGGAGLLRGTRPLLIAANHRSHGDTPAIAMNVPPERRPHLRFLASAARFGRAAAGAGVTQRVERWAMHGLAVHGYGAILVGGEYVGLSAVAAMVEALEAGSTVVVYPEGTRDASGALGTLRPGVVIAAVQAGVPIVPIRLDGVSEALPKSARWVRSGVRITLRVRAPIVPAPGEAPDVLLARLEAALQPAKGGA